MAVLYIFVAIAMTLTGLCGYLYRPLHTEESTLPDPWPGAHLTALYQFSRIELQSVVEGYGSKGAKGKGWVARARF